MRRIDRSRDDCLTIWEELKALLRPALARAQDGDQVKLFLTPYDLACIQPFITDALREIPRLGWVLCQLHPSLTGPIVVSGEFSSGLSEYAL